MNIRKIIASAAALTVASLSSGCGAAEVLYGESLFGYDEPEGRSIRSGSYR